ncbi:MAG: pyridoxamine 5'-phosphate oxidase family protein [Acidobacteriota bacterium]
MSFDANDLDFLSSAVIPVRLSVLKAGGAPALASLWFEPHEDALWCAVQEDAFIARCLGNDPRCAFEVAGDLPPYKGLRGPATGRVEAAEGKDVLARLLDRYLGEGNAELRDWLWSRAESEVALRIVPERITRWDFSARMQPSGPSNRP